MKSQHHHLWMVAIVFCLSCGLLLAAAWPVSRVQNELALPDLPLPQQRKIVIDEPAFMRVDDKDWVLLSLTVDESAQQPASKAQFDDLYASHNVVAVVRLELPGLGAWQDELREPLRPGRPVSFRWAVRADQAGASRGVIWLYLEFVPQAGGEVQKMILLSRPITLEAVTVLGLPAWIGRWAGGVGLAGSLLFVLIDWLRRHPTHSNLP